MRPISYHSRRTLCRLGFVLLCALPTVGVLQWCVACWLPGREEAWRQTLSRELGLAVTLESVAHPRPGVTVFEGITVSDPETGLPVAHVPRLQMAWTDEETVLTLDQVEIEAAALARLAESLERALMRRPPDAANRLHLEAVETMLRHADREEPLGALTCDLGNLQDGSMAEIVIQRPPASEPLRLKLFRAREEGPVVTGFELSTGDAPLEMEHFAPWLDVGEWLGPRARFRGYVLARRWPQGWTGRMNGDLTGMDLEQLVARHFAHDLRGTARLTIAEAQFESGRLLWADGSLAGGPGFISPSLLAAAESELALVVPGPPPRPNDMVPFEELAAAFQMDAGGLRLSGCCQESPAGTVLAGRGGAIAKESPRAQSPLALVRLLAPLPSEQAPAGPATQWLLGILPAAGGGAR